MRPRIGTLCLVLLPVPHPLRADVVELKTGEKVEGNFKRATGTLVEIEVGGQLRLRQVGR